MAAEGMELGQWAVQASSADVQAITERVLEIWEHPRVQACVGGCSLNEMVWTDFQNMGATDLKLGFSGDSSAYPDISITTEQSLSGFDELPEDADLVSSTIYEFVASRKLFGLPTYKAKYLISALSIDNETLSPDDGIIPDPMTYQKLTRTERLRVTKGRREKSTRLTMGHAAALHDLLRQYDPDLVQLEPEKNER